MINCESAVDLCDVVSKKTVGFPSLFSRRALRGRVALKDWSGGGESAFN